MKNIVIFPSAARTTTQTSQDISNNSDNYIARGVILTLDVTSITASPSLTLSVQFKDIASGKYETILTAGAAVVATGTHSYMIYPVSGVAASDITQVVNYPLPSVWRVTITVADSDSATYSLGAMLLA